MISIACKRVWCINVPDVFRSAVQPIPVQNENKEQIENSVFAMTYHRLVYEMFHLAHSQLSSLSLPLSLSSANTYSSIPVLFSLL